MSCEKQADLPHMDTSEEYDMGFSDCKTPRPGNAEENDEMIALFRAASVIDHKEESELITSQSGQ